MADSMISAAPEGQPATGFRADGGQQAASPAQEQAQPQVNYVNSKQLNAAVEVKVW